MPLYMLIRPTKKGRVRGTKGLRDHMRSKRAQACYTVEAPQEFDEEGKELGPDAQVWKTYVREADQVDEELVDGWNKSMDVILIFAALFSAISTAFVIESYKNLKQDPADASSQTLFTISQTLAFIANGSQPTTFTPASEEEPPFQASAKAICVNVLWFLSLSISVAVSLISMLAKEWCLEFMAGRTGPSGAQARRRQQRWDGLVRWRMKEVIVMLPSLIHVALLLFAIGLCVFLWDVHLGVAIPVVIVTTLTTGAYMACTILPFFHDLCPYGTVISRSLRQFMNITSKLVREDAKQDEVTARAIHWMIVNCETPRSVDVALQSLAAAEETLPPDLLQECNAWTLIKRRLDSANALESGQNQSTTSIYERALKSHLTVRRRTDDLKYGDDDDTRRLEQLALGVQSCINSAIQEISSNPVTSNQTIKRILERCGMIAQRYLQQRFNRYVITYHDLDIAGRVLYLGTLVEDLVQLLEQYYTGEVDLDPSLYHVLSASLSFALCCNAPRGPGDSTVNAGYVLRLLRVSQIASRSGDHVICLNLILGALWILISRDPSPSSGSSTATGFASIEKALETLWAGMMITMYSDNSPLKRIDTTYVVHGMLHLLANPSHYGLSSDESQSMSNILENITQGNGLSGKIHSRYHAEYIQDITRDLITIPNVAAFTPQFLWGLYALTIYSPWEQGYLFPTPEIYLFLVNAYLDDSRSTDTLLSILISCCPFPSLSPHLIGLLSTGHMVTRLHDLAYNSNIKKKAFAIAQLWLLIGMSLQEPNRTSSAPHKLEKALLQLPRLEKSLEKQEQVAEELETELSEVLRHHSDELNPHLEIYLYRVLEVMLQRRCTPLPQTPHRYLDNSPQRLRGLESFVNLETGMKLAYPDLVLDSGEVVAGSSKEGRI